MAVSGFYLNSGDLNKEGVWSLYSKNFTGWTILSPKLTVSNVPLSTEEGNVWPHLRIWDFCNYCNYIGFLGRYLKLLFQGWPWPVIYNWPKETWFPQCYHRSLSKQNEATWISYSNTHSSKWTRCLNYTSKCFDQVFLLLQLACLCSVEPDWLTFPKMYWLPIPGKDRGACSLIDHYPKNSALVPCFIQIMTFWSEGQTSFNWDCAMSPTPLLKKKMHGMDPACGLASRCLSGFHPNTAWTRYGGTHLQSQHLCVCIIRRIVILNSSSASYRELKASQGYLRHCLKWLMGCQNETCCLVWAGVEKGRMVLAWIKCKLSYTNGIQILGLSVCSRCVKATRCLWTI